MPKLTDYPTVSETKYDGNLIFGNRRDTNKSYVLYMIVGGIIRDNATTYFVLMDENFEYFHFDGSEDQLKESIQVTKEEIEEKRKLYGE